MNTIPFTSDKSELAVVYNLQVSLLSILLVVQEKVFVFCIVLT